MTTLLHDFMESNLSQREYVLITTAYNEGQSIAATIEAVLSQSAVPRKWVIVSDGSTDGTDSIIRQYAAQNHFIEYIRRERNETSANFMSKVHALHKGYSALSGTSFKFIGILDADITFDSNYYDQIIGKFDENPRLGIAGGFIYERVRDTFRSRPSNSVASVAGAIQLFRRECYETIGGHVPISYGGEDWLCEILARKQGWTVMAFPSIVAYHHKPNDAKRGVIKDSMRQGMMDYTVGSHPLFEFMKCIRRVRESPLLLRASLRFLGYTWSALKGDSKAVPNEVVDYLRHEQMERVWAYISTFRK